MSEFSENTYWIAVAHLPRWTIDRTNRFIIQIIHEEQLSWADFFALDREDWKKLFDFTEKELSDLESTKTDLPRLAFVAEQLHNEGCHIIPINSESYPAVLKEHLKVKSSPPVLYIKGRRDLLQEKAVAIVGARKAGEKALQFTDFVAKKCAEEAKLVVSGFAKGVDKQALDSTLEAKGKSIIVLPQGILTFQSGFKKYYEQIVNGEVLALSTFPPQAGWNVGYAMTRNAYIYGLANEIYVAESDDSGGTWEGVKAGLKRGHVIYVRQPEKSEKNANNKLITLGAIAVDSRSEILKSETTYPINLFQSAEINTVSEPVPTLQSSERNIEKEILALLKTGTYTSKEIVLALKLDWDSRTMAGLLKKNPNIKTISGKPTKYTKADVEMLSLFEEYDMGIL